MNNDPIAPQLPFVWPWPVPNPSAGTACPVTHQHFECAVREAKSVSGVVSAIDVRAINWMEGYLADGEETQLRLVISLHPTCRTSESVLQNLVWLVDRHHPRAAFKVYPESSLLDRSSNLLCLCGTDGILAIATGPTENLGFVPASPSHANLVTQVGVTN